MPPAAELALVLAARAKRPDNPRLWSQAGVLLDKTGQWPEARAALEESLRVDPQRFAEWGELARVLARLGEPEAALAICRRGLAMGPDGTLFWIYGNLLRRQGRNDEARAAYDDAVRCPGQHLSALNFLLQFVVADSAEACLARIEALDAPYRATAVVRAWRAVAFSKLGRRDEAMAIMDPVAHVLRVPFEPPATFGGIEAFNRLLAEEILADPPPFPTFQDTVVNDRPRRTGKPALTALHAFGRMALADFVVDHRRRGLADTPPPRTATLEAITSVVSGNGSNRQHLHETSYASGVYHVRVPDAVRRSDGVAGALEFGGCDQLVTGHSPCWGRMHHKPVEGWLVLFPSHMFHDVVPTGVPDLRISTAVEMVPAGL